MQEQGQETRAETGECGAAGAKRPVVLLAATCLWPCASKLAILLSRLGCDVAAAAPKSHTLHRARAVSTCMTYHARWPLRTLEEAIARTRADLVIPCDDRVVLHLHRLHARTSNPALRQVIERSLGDPSAFATVETRIDLLALARKLGVDVPEGRELRNDADLEEWIAAHPAPWVLKVDGSWGGEGVRIVSTAAQARRAFRALRRRIAPLFALRQLLLRQNLFVLTPWLHEPAARVSAQAHVQGRPANCALAAWRGDVLGAMSANVIVSDGATGPASIIRLDGNPRMAEAGAKIVAALGASGLVGFDFVIERATGKPWLVEMNPRATPIAHLQPGQGRDLAAPLVSKAFGARVSAPTVFGETVALYPQALFVSDGRRELEGAYLDVPLEDPLLARLMLRRPWLDRNAVCEFLDSIGLKAVAKVIRGQGRG
jgi:hypothetical protein